MIIDLLLATLLGMIILPLYESLVGLYYVIKHRYIEEQHRISWGSTILSAHIPWRYNDYTWRSFRSISPWSINALFAWAIIAAIHYLVLRGVGL